MLTLLIANRGEIALRIMHTAKREGYRTLAVFSDADRDSPHVRSADAAIAIGGSTSATAYLDVKKIIAAAKQGGADAIHPGYGFLSENPRLAQACVEGGLSFIGPDAATIALMGNKRQAKVFAESAGIRCIPGFHGNQDNKQWLNEAKKLGFPIMLKAASGGGGRGMRLANDTDELTAGLKSVKNEAQSAFGDDEIIMEKALRNARHIEIQIFSDSLGNTLHLGERDCSIQRRHQKIIEESPAPGVDETLRQNMGKAAVKLANACNYRGAGTVEFLLDEQNNFYFLEMNTRLQVEHGVTEMCYGVDLVAWQLKVARGEPLPFSQQQLHHRGHCIEVRLYAEDPQQNFLPQTGRVHYWRVPQGEGIRMDHALAEGMEISHYYDPMLGKLLCWGENREQARRRLSATLNDLAYLGPVNNQFFLYKILESAAFIAGAVHSGFLTQQIPMLMGGEEGKKPAADTLAIAVLLLHEEAIESGDRQSGRANWRTSVNPLPLNYRLGIHSSSYSCQILPLGRDADGVESYSITVQEQTFRARLLHQNCANITFELNGLCQNALGIIKQQALYLFHRQCQWHISNITYQPASSEPQLGNGKILAPMDGSLIEIHVATGMQVRRGETLALMEAMKMEHLLRANCNGVVTAVHANTGSQLRNGQLLIEIKPCAELKLENP
ncbi:MAG: ATP-grasp domain-containing protein [Gammaproteobacteria bacterium]|nr:ATP-grasp domain-containing protein [Gammaproteobacteria bacterium]